MAYRTYMLSAPLSDRLDPKCPGRTPSTESEALPCALQRTTGTAQLPLSEPMQWLASPASDSDLSQLEVRHFCWCSYLLLPKPPDRCLQFALPLKSSRLGSVTEPWWGTSTIYPAIVAAKYDLESLAAVPAEVSSAVSAAEAAISRPVARVSAKQQHILAKAKIRYILVTFVLLAVLLVLGLAGYLADAELVAVCVLGVGLLAGWCLYWACVSSAQLRRSYMDMRQHLEALCQSDLGLKGYSMRVVGPFVLQFLQSQPMS